MTRRSIELVCRGIAFVTLLVAMWLTSRTGNRAEGQAFRLPTSALADSSGNDAVRELVRAMPSTARAEWPTLSITATRIPDRSVRAALATARDAGMPIRWTDSTGARGLTVAATAEPDPRGGALVHAQANAKQPLIVRDAASTLDSSSIAGDGMSLQGARLSGRIDAMQQGSRASITVPSPAALRRVLLVARPGWEAKFVTAALEERGWPIDASLKIARNASVSIGVPAVADTSRYSVVVVLDSGLIAGAPLLRFVQQGGGVVLSGDALQSDAYSRWRPASISGVRPAIAGALLTDAPKLGLDAYTLRPSAGAVSLRDESSLRASNLSVVVSRVGTGRILASAYRETWRWRMEGGDDGAERHRAFWGALVSAVAFVPVGMDTTQTASGDAQLPGDAAPYADLVARLGGADQSSGVMTSPTPSSSPDRTWMLYFIALAALLVEWGSRRLRGAR